MSTVYLELSYTFSPHVHNVAQIELNLRHELEVFFYYIGFIFIITVIGKSVRSFP